MLLLFELVSIFVESAAEAADIAVRAAKSVPIPGRSDNAERLERYFPDSDGSTSSVQVAEADARAKAERQALEERRQRDLAEITEFRNRQLRDLATRHDLAFDMDAAVVSRIDTPECCDSVRAAIETKFATERKGSEHGKRLAELHRLKAAVAEAALAVERFADESGN